tara:strand:+ start:660 stop:812 length:153 start_codon:yes stop_codon:yes gene_type:complete
LFEVFDYRVYGVYDNEGKEIRGEYGLQGYLGGKRIDSRDMDTRVVKLRTA